MTCALSMRLKKERPWLDGRVVILVRVGFIFVREEFSVNDVAGGARKGRVQDIFAEVMAKLVFVDSHPVQLHYKHDWD